MAGGGISERGGEFARGLEGDVHGFFSRLVT